MENDNTQSQTQWGREVVDALTDSLQIANGDAQGIYEAHPFEVAQQWGMGANARAAAIAIGSASANRLHWD